VSQPPENSLESGEIEGDLAGSAVDGQARTPGHLKKKADQGTLTSHDVPEAERNQPANPAKLVFFDATELPWCPEVGNSDVSPGAQLRVESPGLDKPWDALFGRLEYPPGEGLSPLHQRKRHQEVRAHLERLLERDPDAFWMVVLDNASAHTTPKLDEFWHQHPARLGRVFQPTDRPPRKLIERLWRLMRSQMTRKQVYHRLQELAEAVVEWLEKLPFSKFCSLRGIDEAQLVFVK
jgi:transposase